MSYRWKLYCQVHQMQYIWSDTAPTQCPINSSDPVNSDVVIDKVVRLRTTVDSPQTISSATYQLVGSFITQGSSFFNIASSPPLYIKIVTSVDTGGYNIRLLTQPDQTVLHESPILTNTEPAIYTIDTRTLTYTPATETVIDLQLKSNDGGTITYRNASIYVVESA